MFQVSKEDTIRAILQYLESQKYFSSLVALEKDSQIKLRNYGTELDFFYDLLMDGRFEDTEKFIEPLQNTAIECYSQVLSYIKKQRFLEALEFPADSKLENLAVWLKELEKISDKEDFNALCYCMSLDHIQDHPEYSDWTIWKGRAYCFQLCHAKLVSLYSVCEQNPPKIELS